MEPPAGNVFLSLVRDWWEKITRGSSVPRPFFGIALLACLGILTGEGANQVFCRGPVPAWPEGPWLGCAVFFVAAGSFAWRPRRWLCATAVLCGFAALHVLRLNEPASIHLAEELAGASGNPENINGDGDATGDDAPSEYAAPPVLLRARGIVLDEPRASVPTGGSVNVAAGKNWRFTLGLSFADVRGRAWRCRARVAVAWRNGPEVLAIGDRLEITGTGGRIGAPRNPGEFDLAALLRRRDIRTEIRCAGIADVQRLPPAGFTWGSLLPGMARRFQAWTHAHLTRGLEEDEEASAVISTILLGLRSEPGLGELEELLQRTGTLHFFAIDGLKLGLIALILGRVLAMAGLRRQWQMTFILPFLFAYALATGLGPASLRAVIVAAVLAGGEWIGRPVRSLNSLGAAAALILLFDTQQLFQLGFQLTFLVVLAILLLGTPLYRALVPLGAPDPFLPPSLFSPGRKLAELARRHVLGLACVSCAASIGSFPLMLAEFNVISPISLPANVLVFPVAFGIIALGLLAVVAGVFSSAWMVWINNANWLLAKLFLAGVRLCDAVPGGSFYAATPEWRWERPAAEVTVLDLPYGARAMHIRAGQEDWLLDTGRLTDYHRTVLPYLRSRGVDRLTGLILTQPDGGHLAAVPQVLADLRPGKVFDSAAAGRGSSYQRDFAALTTSQKITVTHWRRGAALALPDETRLSVFYPPVAGAAGRTAGDKALVLQLQADGWKCLFLGDSGVPSALALVRDEPTATLRSAVLVSAPAPASLERVPELWRAVSPRLVVFTRGRESLKGNGAAPVRQRAELPADMLSAARGGAVTLRFYPDRMEAGTYVDGRTYRRAH